MNVNYLIFKYDEALEKMSNSHEESNRQYWKGSMDSFHNILCVAFKGWAEFGTVGYYVFTEGCSYDEALERHKDLFLKTQ